MNIQSVVTLVLEQGRSPVIKGDGCDAVTLHVLRKLLADRVWWFAILPRLLEALGSNPDRISAV